MVIPKHISEPAINSFNNSVNDLVNHANLRPIIYPSFGSNWEFGHGSTTHPPSIPIACQRRHPKQSQSFSQQCHLSPQSRVSRSNQTPFDSPNHPPVPHPPNHPSSSTSPTKTSSSISATPDTSPTETRAWCTNPCRILTTKLCNTNALSP